MVGPLEPRSDEVASELCRSPGIVSDFFAVADATALRVRTAREDATRASMRVDRELDMATAGILADALAGQLNRGRRCVRLDVSGLSFCDCSGLNVFVQTYHRFLAGRASLVLTGVGPRLAWLLAITELDALLLCNAAPSRPTASQAPVATAIQRQSAELPEGCPA